MTDEEILRFLFSSIESENITYYEKEFLYHLSSYWIIIKLTFLIYSPVKKIKRKLFPKPKRAVGLGILIRTYVS